MVEEHYIFTEKGVAMLSSVLHTEKAIQINIQIMNTFVQMRQWAIENKDLARRISELESYFIEHCKDYNKDMSKILLFQVNDKNFYMLIGGKIKELEGGLQSKPPS